MHLFFIILSYEKPHFNKLEAILLIMTTTYRRRSKEEIKHRKLFYIKLQQTIMIEKLTKRCNPAVEKYPVTQSAYQTAMIVKIVPEIRGLV